MPIHKPGLVYQTDAGTIVSVSPTYTGNSEYRFDFSVPDGTTNLLFNVTFPTDDLLSCVLSSDQVVTLKVNSTSAPTPTINLLAGKPISWQNDSAFTNPFTTTPVTAVYISNASGAAANVKLYFLVDSD